MIQADDDRIGQVVREAVSEWKDFDDSDTDGNVGDYHGYVLRKILFIVVCAVVAVLVTGVALTIGESPISFVEVYETIWNHITGNIQNKFNDYVIIELRMPRVVVGLLAGAGLAACGAVMQSIMMNPLTDTYTTGVSSGAVFGVTIAMVMGFTVSTGQMGIVLNAFIFALIPTTVIIIFSSIRKVSPTAMVMVGIAIMYMFNALTTVMKLWATDSTLADIYVWTVGSLSLSGWPAVPYLVAFVIPGVLFFMLLSRQINVLTTGDENATAMGINVDSLRRILMILIALMAAAIVSFTGLIGFVGLVVPHVCRIFLGADNRYLIPASAMFGSMMLVAADLIGRTIIAPSVLQVGVVTSFLGGPMFIWLIMRKKGRSAL